MGSASTFLLLALAAVPFLCIGSAAYSYPPLVKGLSWNFYKKSCPEAESIVRKYLRKAIKRDIGLAAGLLRIHFHDCFVQGCDGSVLLSGTNSEQEAPPNLSLRQSGFTAINEIRDLLEKKCGRIVSCSDIATLAARDSVFLTGGPDYKVPTGRRDGLTFASTETTQSFLPPPTANTTTLINDLAGFNLDIDDLVALSGGHTIGIAHCSSFTSRLYPSQDPVMGKTFAKNLKFTCPQTDTDNTDNEAVLDIRSPNVFDNKYYMDLMNRKGILTSDQDLFSNRQTKSLVVRFAVDENLFFRKFAYSMVKMSMLNVLTGGQGEIRANCTAPNPSGAEAALSTLVHDASKAAAVAAAATI